MIDIPAIVQALKEGRWSHAIALIREQARSQKRQCQGQNKDGTQCDRILATQARGDYCKMHRFQAPQYRSAIKARVAAKRARDKEDDH